MILDRPIYLYVNHVFVPSIYTVFFSFEFSASEMTYIVSSGALNSTHSLTSALNVTAFAILL